MHKRYRLGSLGTYSPKREEINIAWKKVLASCGFQLSDIARSEIRDSLEWYQAHKNAVRLDGKDLKKLMTALRKVEEVWKKLPSEELGHKSSKKIGYGQRYLVQYFSDSTNFQIEPSPPPIDKLMKDISFAADVLSELSHCKSPQARSPIWDGTTINILEILELDGIKITISERSENNNAAPSKTELFFRELYKQAKIKEHFGEYAFSHALARANEKRKPD